jgi:hypothetical protein
MPTTKWTAFLFLLPLALASCNDEGSGPEPPFKFRLLNWEPAPGEVDKAVLLDLDFPEGYTAALSSAGTYDVVVTQSGSWQTLTVSLGFCAHDIYDCTGGIALEELSLSLNQNHGYIEAFSCMGPDGSVIGGIDVARHGSCEE